MIDNTYLKSAMALVALKYIPPMISKSLIEDVTFRNEFKLQEDVILQFDNSNVAFKRDDLFNAVRCVLAGASWKQVVDIEEKKWRIKNISQEKESALLAMIHGDQHFILPYLEILSPENTKRLHALEEASLKLYLPIKIRNKWQEIFKNDLPKDYEIDVYLRDINNLPSAKAQLIKKEFNNGQYNISTLVPPSHDYFENLIGIYTGSTSIQDYIIEEGKIFLDQFSYLKPFDSFLFSLLLSSHSSITTEIKTDQMSSEDIEQSFKFLINNGDRISQLGAIEIGLGILPSQPMIEPLLIQLIKQIRDEDINKQYSGCKLLSALFILVDGELSRIQLFKSNPPFYRRLASLTQAALIQRQIVNSPINVDQFYKNVFEIYGFQFYIQSLVDMRLEPFWNPYLSTASQFKTEFISRIIISALKQEQNIKDSSLHNLILGKEPESLQSKLNSFSSFLPGPLGIINKSLPDMPSKFSNAITESLVEKIIEPKSFTPLINFALIYPISEDHVEMAVKALIRGNYRFVNLENRDQLLSLLNGLATVAAVTRSKTLSTELKYVFRQYRNNSRYSLSIKEIMFIYLTTAASFSDLNEWRNFIGDCMTELAFSDLRGNEGEDLYSTLQCLCQIDHGLWFSCGKANAALLALNTSLSRSIS